MPVRRQPIIWTNDRLVYRCIYASPGLNELMISLFLKWQTQEFRNIPESCDDVSECRNGKSRNTSGADLNVHKKHWRIKSNDELISTLKVVKSWHKWIKLKLCGPSMVSRDHVDEKISLLTCCLSLNIVAWCVASFNQFTVCVYVIALVDKLIYLSSCH